METTKKDRAFTAAIFTAGAVLGFGAGTSTVGGIPILFAIFLISIIVCSGIAFLLIRKAASSDNTSDESTGFGLFAFFFLFGAGVFNMALIEEILKRL